MLLPVLPALHMFQHTYKAFTRGGQYDINRRWKEDYDSSDFDVVGSLQPATEKDLRHFPEGDRSGGGMVFYTQCELKFTDTSQQTGQETTQTFIRHEGEIWRVIGVMPWTRDSGHKKYQCVKYLDSRNHK